MDELEALLMLGCTCLEKENNISANAQELISIYKERNPVLKQNTITGTCYSWTDEFIYLCRYAMSTDSLQQMNSLELSYWEKLVKAEDGTLTTGIEDVTELDRILSELVNCSTEGRCSLTVDELQNTSVCTV